MRRYLPSLDWLLLAVGVALIAAAASYVHPAAALLVVGVACVALAVAPTVTGARR